MRACLLSRRLPGPVLRTRPPALDCPSSLHPVCAFIVWAGGLS